MTSGGGKDDDLLESDPELADLVRTLRSYGVLTRAELLERSGGRSWSDRGFNAALRRGVAGGAIKELGDSLFEVARTCRTGTRLSSIPLEIRRPHAPSVKAERASPADGCSRPVEASLRERVVVDDHRERASSEPKR
jgi:hypothetical protein